MNARKTNRGAIYVRRSTNRQETSLFTQLEWSLRVAAELGVVVDASAEDLEYMLENGLSHYKGLWLDDGVTGADLSRAGFRSVNEDVLEDKSISHLFVFRRDRYARPDDAVDAVQIEKKLSGAGVT